MNLSELTKRIGEREGRGTSERKLDHVRICLNRDVQARQVPMS